MSAVDVDGWQFAALDLVQHGLSGDPEGFGRFVEAEPALGRLGLDPVAESLVDAETPRRARCDLFGGDKAVTDPPVERDPAEPEEPFGFGHGDHDGIVVEGSDIGLCRRLIDRNTVVGAQDRHPCPVKGSPVAVRRLCLARITAIARSS